MMRPKWRFLILCLGMLALMAMNGCAGRETETSQSRPPKAESLMTLGDGSLREGRYRTAMQQYMEADALDPKNPELKFRIALVYADYYGRLDDAVRYYLEALRLKDNYSDAYNNLGVVYSRQKRWDEAIDMFKQALRSLYYPTPEFAHFNLGQAYRGKGDLPKAIEHFQTAIELKGQYEAPHIELGLIYEEQGQNAQALQSFQRARSILEKREPKKGKSSEAEWEAYRSAFAGICYHQGAAFAKLRRFAEAREAYQKALDMAPAGEVQKRIQLELQSLP